MAKGFNIEVSDRAFSNILKKYKNRVDALSYEIDVEMEASVRDMVTMAQQLAPVNNDVVNSTKGRLRGSISMKKVQPYEYQLVAQTKYAAYHEFGTGREYVVPEYKEWQELAAQFKGRGIKQVNIKPRPFMRPSILTYWPKFKEQVIKILKDERRSK